MQIVDQIPDSDERVLLRIRDFVLAPVVLAREALEDGDRWLAEGWLEAAEIELVGILDAEATSG